ncbi:MAG: hypothetical protein KIT48_04815 [Pseudolabrys sp.]|nr:hypothetical protein [Pseudolabrys sp.]
MDVDKQVRRLVRAEAKILERDREIADLQAEQERERSESNAAKERLALAVLRRQGAFELPASRLVALLSGFEVPSLSEQGVIMTPPPPPPPPLPPPSEPEAIDGQQLPTVDVSVRISRNAAEEKREALSSAGLKWNGRAGRWVGSVGRSDLANLQAVFGDRVATSGTVTDGAISAPTPPAEPEPAGDPVVPRQSPLPPRQPVADTGPVMSGGEAGGPLQGGAGGAPQGLAATTPLSRLPARPLPRFVGR